MQILARFGAPSWLHDGYHGRVSVSVSSVRGVGAQPSNHCRQAMRAEILERVKGIEPSYSALIADLIEIYESKTRNAAIVVATTRAAP
jgi:hypothetical protein